MWQGPFSTIWRSWLLHNIPIYKRLRGYEPLSLWAFVARSLRGYEPSWLWAFVAMSLRGYEPSWLWAFVAEGARSDEERVANEDAQGWTQQIAHALSKIGLQLQSALLDEKKLLGYIIEWCDSPPEKASGCCYIDCCIVYDASQEEPLRFVPDAQRTIFLSVYPAQTIRPCAGHGKAGSGTISSNNLLGELACFDVLSGCTSTCQKRWKHWSLFHWNRAGGRRAKLVQHTVGRHVLPQPRLHWSEPLVPRRWIPKTDWAVRALLYFHGSRRAPRAPTGAGGPVQENNVCKWNSRSKTLWCSHTNAFACRLKTPWSEPHVQLSRRD